MNTPAFKNLREGMITKDKVFEKLRPHWFQVMRKYAETWGWEKREAHWGYRERTHIGFLAAAVWKAGGVALEEYSTDKFRETNKGSQKGNGRCDLFFRIKKQGYTLEAKHAWSTLGSEKRSLKPIKRNIRWACKDAAAVQGQGKQLGVVFITIKNPAAIPQKEDVDEAIRRWLEALQHHRILKSYYMLAWFFPEEARMWPSPGTVAVMARPHMARRLAAQA